MPHPTYAHFVGKGPAGVFSDRAVCLTASDRVVGFATFAALHTCRLSGPDLIRLEISVSDAFSPRLRYEDSGHGYIVQPTCLSASRRRIPAGGVQVLRAYMRACAICAQHMCACMDVCEHVPACTRVRAKSSLR